MGLRDVNQGLGELDSAYAIMTPVELHWWVKLGIKSLLINSLIVMVGFTSPSLLAAETTPAAANPTNIKDDMGYFFGFSFGNMLKEGGNEDVDVNGLLRGLKDSLADVMPNLTTQQQEAVIAVIQANQAKQQEVRERAQAAAEADRTVAAQKNLADAQSFLKENLTRVGVMSTASGLQYQVLVEGTGAAPSADANVRVHYEGKLLDGSIFDSSIARGEPAEFGLKQVITGWTEGLQLMKQGGKMRLFIPPQLGYGPGGVRGIPPNALLIFEVELIEIKKPG